MLMKPGPLTPLDQDAITLALAPDDLSGLSGTSDDVVAIVAELAAHVDQARSELADAGVLELDDTLESTLDDSVDQANVAADVAAAQPQPLETPDAGLYVASLASRVDMLGPDAAIGDEVPVPTPEPPPPAPPAPGDSNVPPSNP